MMSKAFCQFFAKKVKEMAQETGLTLATTVVGTATYEVGMAANEKTKELSTKLQNQEGSGQIGVKATSPVI